MIIFIKIKEFKLVCHNPNHIDDGNILPHPNAHMRMLRYVQSKFSRSFDATICTQIQLTWKHLLLNSP